MTKNELQEWRSHPVTQEVFKAIKEAEISALSSQIYYEGTKDTAESIAMRCAFNSGLSEGVSAFARTYDFLEESLA